MKKDRDGAKKIWEKVVKTGFEPAVYNAFRCANICRTEFDVLADSGHALALNYRAYVRMNSERNREGALADLERAIALGCEEVKGNYRKATEKKLFGLNIFIWEYKQAIF